MFGYIDGYNFKEMNPMKYWAAPSSWDTEKKKTTLINRIYSGEWCASEKKDGYFSKFVKDEDGNILLFSRSRNVKGEYPEKHEWVPQLQPFFEALPNGTCILGELYLPSKPGSSNITTLLGCLKEKCIARQEAGEKLHFYAFDVLAFDGISYMKKPASERFAKIEELGKEYTSDLVSFATYYHGQELWNKLQEILAEGGEGMVIIRDGSLYQPDKRPSKDTQKAKKELQETLDVFIYGGNPPTRLYSGKEIESWQYWQNTVTHELMCGDYYKKYFEGDTIEPVTKMYYMRGAGSLKIGAYKDGKPVQIGSLSGLDEEILLNWKDYIGKVAEVTCMEVMRETQGLRHPRFIGWREDKVPRDCQWETIFG